MISKELEEILPDIVKDVLEELSLAKITLSEIISQLSATHEEKTEKEEVPHNTDIQTDSDDESETDEEKDADKNSKKSEEHDDSDDNSLSLTPITQEEVGKMTRPVISGPMLMRKQRLLAEKKNNSDGLLDPGETKQQE
eukprot:12399785-Ditylum_brightwellii.AAC.1